MTKIKGLVLAGNYRQYTNWLKETKNKEREYPYIYNEISLCGQHVNIIKIGSWRDNPVIYSRAYKSYEALLNEEVKN